MRWLAAPQPARHPATRTIYPNYRWVICGLLLFSTTVNYMDRQVISYLKEYFCTAPDQGGFGWTNSDFANVTSSFTAFYAGMTILAGWVIDRIGTKLGLALSLIIWSVFGILNAFAGRAMVMHALVRSAFGIGEAGNFPASIKTVAEWFPKRERALATGVFNSGSNIGAMISALFVPWCLIHFGDEAGWKMAYILTGSIGFVWLIFWFRLYDTPAKQKRLSRAEFDYIHSDADEVKSGDKSNSKAVGGSFANFFSFNGRVPCNAFWGTNIMILILGLFIYFIALLVLPVDKTRLQVLAVCGVFELWAFLAVQAKRWHDLGKSGLFSLATLLPGVFAAITLRLHSVIQAQRTPAVARSSWLVIMCVVCALAFIASLVNPGFRKGLAGENKFGAATGPGLLGYPQMWSFFAGKFFTDGVWWFYLFWLPDYLKKQFNLDKHQIMLPTFIVYGVAIVGSVYGGSIPMTLMKRGMPVYQARMTAMFLIALCPLAVLFTQYFGDVGRFGNGAAYLAVATICIGAAAHQAWSANLFTTVSDMFPKRAVGSVTGIGAMAGGLGGVVVQKIAGALTDAYKDAPHTAYLFLFAGCAFSYLTAWSVMKMLVPRHRPITVL